jgi:hypothetical protein
MKIVGMEPKPTQKAEIDNTKIRCCLRLLANDEFGIDRVTVAGLCYADPILPGGCLHF